MSTRIVKLLAGGLSRVPGSKVGDCFPVHKMHPDITGKQTIVHVRDYSYANETFLYQVWTLGYLGRDCEELTFKTEIER